MPLRFLQTRHRIGKCGGNFVGIPGENGTDAGFIGTDLVRGGDDFVGGVGENGVAVVPHNLGVEVPENRIAGTARELEVQNPLPRGDRLNGD